MLRYSPRFTDDTVLRITISPALNMKRDISNPPKIVGKTREDRKLSASQYNTQVFTGDTYTGYNPRSLDGKGLSRSFASSICSRLTIFCRFICSTACRSHILNFGKEMNISRQNLMLHSTHQASRQNGRQLQEVRSLVYATPTCRRVKTRSISAQHDLRSGALRLLEWARKPALKLTVLATKAATCP